VAEAAGAPVVLVGDIDRGGVFAALVGTLELLDAHERDRVAALLVNKFRGDVSLLTPGLDFLEARTGKPVLGVLPFVRGLRLADEDSLALDERRERGPSRRGEVDVAVVRVPCISNHDEFQPLEHEPGVSLRFVDRPQDLAGADLVILPGSKATASDLRWLRASGIAEALSARAAAGEPLLGVCGGCQMLGQEILDPEAVESEAPATAGLGLLPVRTRFGREKRTTRVRARAAIATFLGEAGEPAGGYEIHMGRLERAAGASPAFAVLDRNGLPEEDADGAVAENVVGTMIHGLLENTGMRRALLASLRRRKGLAAAAPDAPPADEYDRLAEVVRANVRMDLLWKLVGR
jgi:adenosylcobyric acid synthase